MPRRRVPLLVQICAEQAPQRELWFHGSYVSPTPKASTHRPRLLSNFVAANFGWRWKASLLHHKDNDPSYSLWLLSLCGAPWQVLEGKLEERGTSITYPLVCLQPCCCWIPEKFSRRYMPTAQLMTDLLVTILTSIDLRPTAYTDAMSGPVILKNRAMALRLHN